MKVGLPARKADRVYTYRDYKAWPEDERWELIHGVAWNMSAAPSVSHQAVLGKLHLTIGRFLEGKPCQAYLAPLDVFLPAAPDQEDDDVDTVVQPDILVVCDPDKVRDKGVRGAPDWAVEILSPWTTRKDVAVKLELYEEQGVREYWIADPGNRCVHVCLGNDVGRHGEAVLSDGRARVPSTTCPGLVVDLVDLFSVVLR